jgi:hypothetical protein
MSEFSADWLSLREPADRESRSTALMREAFAHLTETGPVRVLDLATGTGANLRFLAPHLRSPQSWRAVDRDRDLLVVLPQRVGAWALDRGLVVSGARGVFSMRGPDADYRVEAQQADLARLDDGLFADVDLVTASALLDLVSESWLRELATACHAVRAVALFALSYDGRLTCAPEDPGDAVVRELVNRHQRSTKGFGPALGPDATACAVRCFEAVGYTTRTEQSDWRIGPSQAPLQRQLIEGWAAAAVEMDPGQTSTLEQWKARRLAHVDRGASEVMVGHLDFAAWTDEP